jgi:hypothetical protein
MHRQVPYWLENQMQRYQDAGSIEVFAAQTLMLLWAVAQFERTERLTEKVLRRTSPTNTALNFVVTHGK